MRNGEISWGIKDGNIIKHDEIWLLEQLKIGCDGWMDIMI